MEIYSEGKNGIIRLVKLRTEKGNLLRPIQRPYPMELKPNYEQVVSENQKVPEVVTEYPELNTDSNKTVPVTRSGREIKPVKRLDLLRSKQTFELSIFEF
ncbi:hypothetical protein NPIL_325891 [Nephila pilipes]|uniref:Uncharacterized protein n=1 Tax=Nephila pilipes TaxID=299642 RepID=A0A8X6Q6U2_NEPPI|nr:hypothetical protein NPIL_654971 [Nephila pilipes]GFU52061.1 hypothetical protein NPIL_325891 [Nephila pilipes]